MKINGNSVIGIWKYSDAATYEKGDFVVIGENIYIVRADTVSGVSPMNDVDGNFEFYPGNLITTKEEYSSIIQNPDLAKDKYVSSAALEQILKSTYFGLDNDGVIDSSIDVSSSGGLRLRGLNGISQSEPLKDLMLSSEFNNGAVRVSKEIPEINGLMGDYSTKTQGDNDFWICCDRKRCIGCNSCVKCGGGNIFKVKDGKKISDLVDSYTGNELARIVINDTNTTKTDWTKPVNICPVDALSYRSSVTDDVVFERSLYSAAFQNGVVDPGEPRQDIIVFDAGFEEYTKKSSSGGSSSSSTTISPYKVGIYSSSQNSLSLVYNVGEIYEGIRAFISDANKAKPVPSDEYIIDGSGITVNTGDYLTNNTELINTWTDESTSGGTVTYEESYTTKLFGSSRGYSCLSIDLTDSFIGEAERKISSIYSRGGIFNQSASVSDYYDSYVLMFIIQDMIAWENYRYGSGTTGSTWTWQNSNSRMDPFYISWDRTTIANNYNNYEIERTLKTTTSTESSTTTVTDIRSAGRTLSGALCALNAVYQRFYPLASSIPFKRSELSKDLYDAEAEGTSSEVNCDSITRLITTDSWSSLGSGTPTIAPRVVTNIWDSIGSVWERNKNTGKYSNANTSKFFKEQTEDRSNYKLTHSVDCVLVPPEVINCFTNYDTLTQEEKNQFISLLDVSRFHGWVDEESTNKSILYDTIMRICGSISGVDSVEKLARVINSVAGGEISINQIVSTRAYCAWNLSVVSNGINLSEDKAELFSSSLPYKNDSSSYDYAVGKSFVRNKIITGSSSLYGINEVISLSITYSEWEKMLKKVGLTNGNLIKLSPRPINSTKTELSYYKITWPTTNNSIDSSVTEVQGWYEQNSTTQGSGEFVILKQYTYRDSNSAKVRVQELIDPYTAQRLIRCGIGGNIGSWRYLNDWNSPNYIMKKISRITDYATTLRESSNSKEELIVKDGNNRYDLGAYSYITIVASVNSSFYSATIATSMISTQSSYSINLTDSVVITISYDRESHKYSVESSNSIVYLYGRKS